MNANPQPTGMSEPVESNLTLIVVKTVTVST